MHRGVDLTGIDREFLLPYEVKTIFIAKGTEHSVAYPSLFPW